MKYQNIIFFLLITFTSLNANSTRLSYTPSGWRKSIVIEKLEKIRIELSIKTNELAQKVTLAKNELDGIRNEVFQIQKILDSAYTSMEKLTAVINSSEDKKKLDSMSTKLRSQSDTTVKLKVYLKKLDKNLIDGSLLKELVKEIFRQMEHFNQGQYDKIRTMQEVNLFEGVINEILNKTRASMQKIRMRQREKGGDNAVIIDEYQNHRKTLEKLIGNIGLIKRCAGDITPPDNGTVLEIQLPIDSRSTSVRGPGLRVRRITLHKCL